MLDELVEAKPYNLDEASMAEVVIMVKAQTTAVQFLLAHLRLHSLLGSKSYSNF